MSFIFGQVWIPNCLLCYLVDKTILLVCWLLLAEVYYVYSVTKTILLVHCRLRNCAFVDFRDEAAANHAHSLLNRFASSITQSVFVAWTLFLSCIN
jgi:hypothetical protein